MKICLYCAEEILDAAIKCRYCGSDLTIAPGNVLNGAHQPLRVAALTQEKEYYKDDRTLVTSRRLVLNGVTYAMSNITSVAIDQKKQNPYPPTFLLCFGGLLIAAGLAIFGVPMIIGGLIWFSKPTTHYIVRIRTGSGETDALQGRKLQSLQPIVDAINQAIVERQ